MGISLPRDKAMQMMQRGMNAVRNGELGDAGRIFDEAYALTVWKVLGFNDWPGLLAERVKPYIRGSSEIPPVTKRFLIIEMRRGDIYSNREIGHVLNCSPSTVAKTLKDARENGTVKNPAHELRGAAPYIRAGAKPSADLAKTWKAAVRDVIRRTGTLDRLADDYRYTKKREELRSTLGDLMRAQAVLTRIVEDLAASTPDPATTPTSLISANGAI